MSHETTSSGFRCELQIENHNDKHFQMQALVPRCSAPHTALCLRPSKPGDGRSWLTPLSGWEPWSLQKRPTFSRWQISWVMGSYVLISVSGSRLSSRFDCFCPLYVLPVIMLLNIGRKGVGLESQDSTLTVTSLPTGLTADMACPVFSAMWSLPSFPGRMGLRCRRQSSVLSHPHGER